MALPDKVINGIDKLAPLPITLQRLVHMLGNEDVNIKDVITVIEYDQAVTSNILKVANSPAYAGRFQIEKLRDAVIHLGLNLLLDLALGNYLKSLKVSAPLYDLSENDLWLHAAASSLAAKAIIQETHNGRIPPIATVAALVHDIGKLLMIRYMEGNLADILALIELRKCSFVEAERELFGCDHAEVGQAMAKKWAFPDPVTEAIHLHHSAPLHDPQITVDVVILSNLAAKTIGVGLGAEGMNLRTDSAKSRERISLSVEGFERVCAQTAFWLSGLKKSHGLN
jgi:putative nucleotidyltransferase with HDIG domain